MDYYNINCIDPLLKIILENEYLQEYVFNSFPPNYQYAHYLDWIMPYLQKQLDQNSKNNFNKQMQSIKQAKILSAISNLEILLKKQKEREFGLLVKNGLNPKEYFKRMDTLAQPQDSIIDENEEHYPIIYSFPQQYILGAPKGAEIVWSEENDDVQVYAIELKTQYCESFPNGDKNLSINSFTFQNMKHEAEKFD